MSEEPESGPLRSRYEIARFRQEPFFAAPAVVVALIALIGLAFLPTLLLPPQDAFAIALQFGVRPAALFGQSIAPGGGVLGLITHVFLHASLMHIGFNVLWLLAFGAPTARRLGAVSGTSGDRMFGSILFLILFFLSAAVGALTFAILNAGSETPLVGASGGVSGLMGAAARFAFRRTAFGPELGRLAPLNDRVVLTWIGFWTLSNILFGIAPGIFGETNQIAWEAHLGGFFFGLLVFPIFDRMARREQV